MSDRRDCSIEKSEGAQVVCGCCACGHEHEHQHEHVAESPFARPLAVVGGVLMAASLLPVWGQAASWILAAGVLLVGYPLFVGGVRGLFTGFVFDELTLLTVAVAASLGLAATSENSFVGVLEAAAVTLFFRLGNLLESHAISKSQRDIEALTRIRPDVATVVDDAGNLMQTPAQTIQIGAVIRLRPGDRVPIDCEVLSGGGYIDLSAITGELLPVTVSIGACVPSGAINLDGRLDCRTVASFQNSAASRIIRLVRESTAQKGTTELLISRFARVYTMTVLGLAAILALLPPLLGWGSLSMWLSRALVFLVASCPCALVISVPLTYFAGVGAASRAGVLVKGTRFLETLARVDCVVFDKTGTLTEGRPVVSECIVADGFARDDLITIAAAAEASSSHPAARAVVEFAGARTLPTLSDYTEHPGKGVSLMMESKRVLCGSARLLQEENIADTLAQADVYVAVDQKTVGCFVLADRPRAGAGEAIAALRMLGVKSVTMLTGDGEKAAALVAQTLALDGFDAGQLPQDKVERLAALKQVHHTTLFVGDGINDAPVLAAADIGVAMGLGTDSAIEAADVVLMGERLQALPEAIRIARRTTAKARQNIVLALTAKAVVLLLGVFGMAAMWMAVVADVGVSILAVLNSMTLLAVEDKTRHVTRH